MLMSSLKDWIQFWIVLSMYIYICYIFQLNHPVNSLMWKLENFQILIQNANPIMNVNSGSLEKKIVKVILFLIYGHIVVTSLTNLIVVVTLTVLLHAKVIFRRML